MEQSITIEGLFSLLASLSYRQSKPSGYTEDHCH